jgi:predicted HicB family RNase H-like nuclease
MPSRAPKQNGETRSASVGLRVKPSLKAALERLARAEERTLNFYIERILEAHVSAQVSAQGSTKRKKGKPR